MPLLGTFGSGSSKSYGLRLATRPDAPVIGTPVSPGSGQMTIPFTAPTNNGGSTITSYTVIADPGGTTSTLNQSGSGTFNLTGLTPAVSYQFKMYATNNMGNSTYSLVTAPVLAAIPPLTSMQVLMVAGGGGGANWGGGGGGAGGLLYYGSNSTPKTPNGAALTVASGQSFAVVIGAGNGLNSSGGNTTFIGGSYNLSATGGGSGGSSHGASARTGGSGGGGTWGQTAVAGTAGQGNSSGNSGTQGGGFGGGLAGGGGAGGVGGNGVSGDGGAGGAGGAGLRYTEFGAYGTDASNSIVPTSGKGYFSSGGGGGGTGGVVGATAGGGGAGGYGAYSATRIGQSAKANTGGGGGGTGDLHQFDGGNNVGAGGNGIVLVSYQSVVTQATGGTIDTTSRSGWIIHAFTGNGTFTVT